MPSRRLVVLWFRRDLRLHDNAALHAAAQRGAEILPVYVTSRWQKRHLWTGPKRQAFLCDALQKLSDSIAAAGGKLLFREGNAVKELTELLKESGAEAIYFNQDPDPFGKNVEGQLKAACDKLGIGCHREHDLTLHGPNEVKTQGGKSYRVFTPYSKNWLGLEKPPILPRISRFASPGKLATGRCPTPKHWDLSPPAADMVESGETAARARLKNFLKDGIETYAERRDLPAEEGTSRLSQDLRFGLLSVRTIYHQALEVQAAHRSAKAKKNIDVFIKELAWREFYMAVLDEFPEILSQEFNPDWRGLPWDEPGEKFEAWKKGRTGFPIVDAGIRQLLATGFMHNRVRMIVAMFLTKDLHLDWRLGEQFFMQHLVDGEIASNNGGWQWSAGVGADAAPYFRIQNPWSQTKRYDPKGEYIKRWVPELKDTPAKAFLQPPVDGQPIAKGYPLPCVDHARERARTLAIFKKHRARKH